MVPARQRDGVLVIRAWVESGSGGLRARIIRSSDLPSGERLVTTAATPEEILAAVRVWLEMLLNDETGEWSSNGD